MGGYGPILVMALVQTLVTSLVLTLVVEIAAGAILGARDLKGIQTVALVNIITNPAVVFIATMVRLFIGMSAYSIAVTVLEIIVLIVEAVLYKKYLWNGDTGRAIKMSLILNFCSYFAGEMINMFL